MHTFESIFYLDTYKEDQSQSKNSRHQKYTVLLIHLMAGNTLLSMSQYPFWGYILQDTAFLPASICDVEVLKPKSRQKKNCVYGKYWCQEVLHP